MGCHVLDVDSNILPAVNCQKIQVKLKCRRLWLIQRDSSLVVISVEVRHGRSDLLRTHLCAVNPFPRCYDSCDPFQMCQYVQDCCSAAQLFFPPGSNQEMNTQVERLMIYNLRDTTNQTITHNKTPRTPEKRDMYACMLRQDKTATGTTVNSYFSYRTMNASSTEMNYFPPHHLLAWLR